MTMTVEPKGECDNRFSAVRDAFAENFASRNDVGASAAVYLDGKLVVDLWGGHADAAGTRSWQRDTIVNIYSITKPMAAICLHRLVDQGKVDWDAPVTRYWPEFGPAGKDAIPVRQLLNHRSGLSGIREVLPTEAFYDWSRMVHALEAQEPWWEPGAFHGYHTVTFGWLIGEIVRRVSGKSLGTYWREEVAEPLGADLIIGLGEKDDRRVADMVRAAPLAPGEIDPMAELHANPESMRAKAALNPPWDPVETINSVEWRRAEIPGVNGHSNGRSLARIFGALARGGELDGVMVLSPSVIEGATVEQSHGPDAITVAVSRFGLGFALSSGTYPMGGNPRTFGHAGLGGSIAFADPDAGIGFGYAMNRVANGIGQDPRVTSLVDALYASL